MSDTKPIKVALKAYLSAHGTTDASKKAFVYATFEKELSTLKSAFKKYDPNHLTLGVRFADPRTVSDDLYKLCAKYVDVVSFNYYEMLPNTALFDHFKSLADKPMLIGEFRYSSLERGYWGGTYTTVSDEKQRGVGYRYYVEHVLSHPSLVGATWFSWNDGSITGAKTGSSNISQGVVDVTDRPYTDLTDAIIETAKVLYNVHCGKTTPYATKPY